ncbi:MAG: hypothetical protein KIT83_06760 [Bryobacterales bacterium]|nr:hypothetical protein [Bryobacterales bacterium]
MLTLVLSVGLVAQVRVQITPKLLPFEEQDGLLMVEAEHFHAQELAETRRWHPLPAKQSLSGTEPTETAPAASASGGAYLHLLPDTRRTHGDKLIPGENFSNQPGRMAVLSYRVRIQNPGRYYVWVRAYSTGSEDNGLHAGLNGEWPESGQRMQWCEGKHRWRWESKQRTDANHCGEEGRICLDIPAAGEHTVMFSMREDGFRFDQWLLTKDPAYVRPADGPETRP